MKARYSDALLPCTTLDASGNAVVIPNAAFGGTNNASFCARSSRLTDSPNFSLTANSEYRFTAGHLQPFIRGLFTYRPRVFSQNTQFEYPHSELLNLFFGVRASDNKWELGAFARNVLGQDKIPTSRSTTAP